MLATASTPMFAPNWGLEIKYDGYRVLAAKANGRVTLVSRNRKNATTWFPEIDAALRKLPGTFLLDGEACVIDENGHPDFEALRSVIRKPGAHARVVAYFAFDLLSIGGRDIRALPFTDRKKALRKLVKTTVGRVCRVDYTVEDRSDFYQSVLALKLEGVVAKRLDAPYTAGRSTDWLKFKSPNYHDGWKRHRTSRSDSSKI
jgi:bifunctional non-homologous end joining protein LigD